MFKINFRIVDDFQELKNIKKKEFDFQDRHIYGFFQVCFGKHIEGSYYHENMLSEYEVGDELIDNWLSNLLDTLIYLKIKSEYIAFSQIETINKWLEFKKIDENIVINIGIDFNNKITSLFLFSDKNLFLYLSPLNYTIKWTDLKNIIVYEVNKFFNELKKINKNILDTNIIIRLKSKLIKLQNLY